jgi:hypothetical protein
MHQKRSRINRFSPSILFYCCNYANHDEDDDDNDDDDDDAPSGDIEIWSLSTILPYFNTAIYLLIINSYHII